MTNPAVDEPNPLLQPSDWRATLDRAPSLWGDAGNFTMKTLVLVATLAAAGLANPASAAQPISDQDIAAFPARALAAHNAVRRAAGVAPLQWDDQLGRDAANYAVILALGNRLEHSINAARSNTGENLWMGTRGAYSVEAMVAGWSSERRLFIPGRFPSVSRSGSWHDVGHYTQMVWPTTRKMGCAIASGYQADVLVCRYFPAGNVFGVMESR